MGLINKERRLLKILDEMANTLAFPSIIISGKDHMSDLARAILEFKKEGVWRIALSTVLIKWAKEHLE